MSESSPNQPVVFTLGEAAKAAGVTKSALSKAIAKGRMSCEGGGNEPYRIQAAELFRVFPPKPGNRFPGGESDEMETPSGNRLIDQEVNGLRERLTILTEERERERRQYQDEIADLRSRLDREAEDRRKLTAILTDQSTRPAAPTPATPRPSLWARLTGKG